MRNLATVLIVLGATLVSSGCMGSGGGFEVEAPEWKAGYSYAYTLRGSSSFAQSAEGHTATEENSWGPKVRIAEVLNTTLDADNEPVYLIGYQDIENGEGKDEDPEEGGDEMVLVPDQPSQVLFFALRQADLAEMGAWINLRTDCSDGGACASQVTNVEFGDAPEHKTLDFPLKKGKTWSTILEDSFGDFPEEMEIKHEARVVGMKTVDVPAGRIEAVQVEVSYLPVDAEAYEEKVKEEAKDEGVDIERFRIDVSRRGTMYYSPEYKMFVKTEWRNEFSFEIRGSAPGGESFDSSGRGFEQNEMMLEGAKLVERPERDFDYMARLFLGKVGIDDPTGQTLQQIRYGLKLTAPKNVVNAAEPELVPFTVTVTDAEALPEGHKVRWHVRDVFGGVQAQGEGISFGVPFPEPGQFEVTAEALDARGSVVAQTGMTIIANYVQSLDVDCGPANVFIPGSCPTVHLPVKPGIRSLRVSVLVDGTLAAANQGTLTVSDGLTVFESDGTKDNGAYEVFLDEFFLYAQDGQEWTAQYTQERAVMEEVRYEIELLYGGGAAATRPSMDEAVSEDLRSWIEAEGNLG